MSDQGPAFVCYSAHSGSLCGITHKLPMSCVWWAGVLWLSAKNLPRIQFPTEGALTPPRASLLEAGWLCPSSAPEDPHSFPV